MEHGRKVPQENVGFNFFPMTPSNPKPGEGHTKTPWREHDMEADAIVGPDRKAIALVMGRSRTEAEDAANMAFILTAVNQHARLLASNAEMRRLLRQVVRGNVEDVLEEIRAALARHPEKE